MYPSWIQNTVDTWTHGYTSVSDEYTIHVDTWIQCRMCIQCGYMWIHNGYRYMDTVPCRHFVHIYPLPFVSMDTGIQLVSVGYKDTWILTFSQHVPEPGPSSPWSSLSSPSSPRRASVKASRPTSSARPADPILPGRRASVEARRASYCMW